MKDGHVPGDVFLPSSYWNDELMYFKQVEAVVSHGLPGAGLDSMKPMGAYILLPHGAR